MSRLILKRLDLRDWFAGMAINGICASLKPEFHLDPKISIEQVAYRIADCMLDERGKKPRANTPCEHDWEVIEGRRFCLICSETGSA